MGDERIPGDLRQKRLDVGSGREPDEIDAGGGVRIHDHAADFVEQAAEAFIGGAGTGGDEQFVLHEFGGGAENAPAGIEPPRFAGDAADGSFAAGQKDLDFLQFGHASQGAAEHLPGQQVVVGFQQGFERLVEFLSADVAGDGGLDARIEPDVDPDAGKLREDLDQRGVFGLEPQMVAIQAEKERLGGSRQQRKQQQVQPPGVQKGFSHRTAW